MKTARVLACCLLVFLLVGTAPRSTPHSRAQSLPLSRERSERRALLLALLHEGGSLFRMGQYSDARSRYEGIRQRALAMGEEDLAARATGNRGGCEFALHQYQPALRSFLEAYRQADRIGDTSAVAAFDANIASLYSEMGEWEAAAQWMQGTLERLLGEDRRDHLPQLQIQMATLRAHQGRMREAEDLFRQGIDGADRSGNLDLYALGWNRVGEELLKSGPQIRDLRGSERALLEAYRIRKLHHLALDSSYRNLGRLRLEQGDLVSASALLDRAVELAARPQGLMPTWDIYHYRGRVRLAQGRLREAMGDLRIALRLARAWRWSAPPNEASRIGTEGMLDQVHSALIEAGNRLYLQTRDPAFVRETFEAAEENRASSLRALLSAPRTTPADLPPSYWETLGRLQRAEVAALRTDNPHTEAALSSLRAEIIRAEGALDPVSQPLPSRLLERTQAALDAETALLSFHLGDSVSWLWALDRTGLALYALPPRHEVEVQAERASRAIRESAADAASAGTQLYGTLFGRLAPRFQRKSRWLLALDEGLFDVPVAALLEGTPRHPVYVAERHITEVIPGAGYWVETVARANAPGLSPVFLGIGDPIYNTADARLSSRLRGTPRSLASPLRLFAASRPASGSALVLPRLVSSSAELDACARAWNGEHILLKGANASRRNLADQLRHNPAVVHFATRIVESSARSAYGLIALSLTNASETEVLSPLEIARWRIQAGLVVLSGCHSAAGAALPGTGLLGLTRAWLAAGAHAVVGSRWATPDEDGALFTALYGNLQAQPRADGAGALRAAQLAMIRAGGWRANPRYWGAYFVVGNQ